VRFGKHNQGVGKALVLALLLAFSSTTAHAQVQDLIRRGIQAYNARQYASAVNNLQAAVARDPENDTAHYYLGNALMACGNKQHALQEYSRAFQYSMDGEMLDNCARVLEAYRQPLPHRTPRSRRSAAGLNPYTTGSVQEMNRLAETRVSQARRAMESHSSSLDVFKTAPENKDGMNRAWDSQVSTRVQQCFENLYGWAAALRQNTNGV
jgi:tetratricopeptide (TPR) repeat protein